MKTLYFDCFSGAAGDMVVGALLDAGAPFQPLRDALATLGVEGFGVRVEQTVRKGIAATKFHVDIAPDVPQPHRHLHHVLAIIAAGDLPQPVKDAAGATFRRLAEAEAEVHGTTIEKVHFHEVGAVDSIVDIVGAHFCLHALGVRRILCSELPTGRGTVTCAHGVYPVPAPATALLLRGLPSYAGDVEAELLTPTAAALLGGVVEAFGPAPAMTGAAIGYGAGTRDLGNRPNVLRAVLGETAAALPGREAIAVLEANVDDMTPEMLAALVQRLLQDGARDAFVTPVTAKKGRPGHLLTVLCDPSEAEAMARSVLTGSTTFGVRMRQEQRVCLERSWKRVATPWGPVRVKLGHLDGAPLRRSPEFEDCRAAGEGAGVPVLSVYEAALAAAVKGEYLDD